MLQLENYNYNISYINRPIFIYAVVCLLSVSTYLQFPLNTDFFLESSQQNICEAK